MEWEPSLARRRRAQSPPARRRDADKVVVQRPRRAASPNPRARRALFDASEANVVAALREKDEALRAFAKLSSELIEIARPFVAPRWTEPHGFELELELPTRRPTRRAPPREGGGAPAWVP